MDSGYNILVPDICRDAMPEITLAAMDAMQAAGHTPVLLSAQATANMYQDYRYAKHGCYEIFQFYYKDLLREHLIDYGFSTGLLGILEDLSKEETHNLLEEAGIPNIVYLHCRDEKPVRRLVEMGAASWRHTFIACSAPELPVLLGEAGLKSTAWCPPATSLRLFYPAAVADSSKPYPLLADDCRLSSEFEVSFAGSWSAAREVALQALLATGVRLAVFGDPVWSQGALARAYRGRANYLTELNTIYNASRIVLDLPHPDCTLDGYISARVVDAMASGSLVLTYQRQGEQPTYEAGRELAVYSDTEDLVSKVLVYLENSVERERIASAGHLRVAQSETWSSRLAMLIPRLELHCLRGS